MKGERVTLDATVSVATLDALDRFVEAQGLARDAVIEQALLAFIEAHKFIPDEALTPTKIVLGNEAFDAVVARLEAPAAPTPALLALMRGHGEEAHDKNP